MQRVSATGPLLRAAQRKAGLIHHRKNGGTCAQKLGHVLAAAARMFVPEVAAQAVIHSHPGWLDSAEEDYFDVAQGGLLTLSMAGSVMIRSIRS